MQVDIYTGDLIKRRDELTLRLERILRAVLDPLQKQILSIEVRLTDKDTTETIAADWYCGHGTTQDDLQPLASVHRSRTGERFQSLTHRQCSSVSLPKIASERP